MVVAALVNRIQRSRDEAAQLDSQPVSRITPSRRDFSQYVAAGKDEPAIIARVSARGRDWSREQLITHAVACDDAEVAALSLSFFDLVPEEIAAIADAVTAPILREDPLLDSNQLYHSRLHGADAIVLPAEHLDSAELTRLVDIAVSMHLAVVVECESGASLEAALRWPYTVIGATSLAAAEGFAKTAPPTRTVILLGAVTTPAEYEAARGICDAVTVGPDGLGDGDVSAALDALRGNS